MQPILHTGRLELRPVTIDNTERLWMLWTTPEVREFLWDDRIIERSEALATIERAIALRGRRLGLWTLHDATSDVGSFVGCAGLLPVDTAAQYEPRLSGLVEPLVALSPEAWGRGYASEALQALLDYAITELDLSQLAAVTDTPNVASDRMLRRVGFNVLSEVAGPRFPLRTYLYSRLDPR